LTKNTKKSPTAVDKSASATKPADSADKIAIKEMTPEEKRVLHIEGIVKTAVAAFVGVVAGLVADFQFGVGSDTKWFATLVIIAILAYYALRLIFPLFKINTKDFGFKDWFYIEFLVLDFCLVTWTLLLN
jgi:hypothetical protein